MWRLVYGIPGWLVYFLLMLPLVLLGFVLVAIMAVLSRYRDTTDADGYRRSHWRDHWMWIFDNIEDGIDGDAIKGNVWKNPDWVASTKSYSDSPSKLVFIWSAWRNSVGNARQTKLFGMTVDPNRVSFTTRRWNGPSAVTFTGTRSDAAAILKTGPYIARQGWRYELRFPWSPTRFFWIGWRIAQQTQVEPAVGFAFQPWGKL